jgi:hypothetical protein
MRRVPISLLLLLSLLTGSVAAPAFALPEEPAPFRSGAREWRAPELAGSLGIAAGKPLRQTKFSEPQREAADLPATVPLPRPASAGGANNRNLRIQPAPAGAPGLARAPPLASYR